MKEMLSIMQILRADILIENDVIVEILIENVMFDSILCIECVSVRGYVCVGVDVELGHWCIGAIAGARVQGRGRRSQVGWGLGKEDGDSCAMALTNGGSECRRQGIL
jgi:hypothetical protein